MKNKQLLIALLICIMSYNQQSVSMNNIVLPEEKTTADYTYEVQVSQPQPAQKQTVVNPDQIDDIVNPITLIRTITKTSQIIENGQIITTTKRWVSKKSFVKDTDQKPIQKNDEELKKPSDQSNKPVDKKAEESSIWDNENLLYGAGIAAGAVLAGGTYALVNHLNRSKEKIVPKNYIDQFKYLNYLDTSDDRSTENDQIGIKNAAGRSIARQASLKKYSKPEIEIEDVYLYPDVDGCPTVDSIKRLMLQEYFSEVLKHDLTVTIVPGGVFTGKMYQVSVKNKPIFFLKITSGERKSHERLMEIQQGKIGRLGVENQYQDAQRTLKISPDKLPVMTWLEKIFKYTGVKVESDYIKGTTIRKTYTGIIEMSHAAKGESVHNILFGQNRESLEKQSPYLVTISKALGYFQQAFMQYPNENDPTTWQTVAHKDFNLSNVFFDQKKSLVYFIDNETMIENAFFLEDVRCFLAYLTATFQGIEAINNTQRSINLQLLAALYSISFLIGYIDSFPENKKSLVANLLLNQSDTYTNVRNARLPMYYSNKTKNYIIESLEAFNHSNRNQMIEQIITRIFTEFSN